MNLGIFLYSAGFFFAFVSIIDLEMKIRKLKKEIEKLENKI